MQFSKDNNGCIEDANISSHTQELSLMVLVMKLKKLHIIGTRHQITPKLHFLRLMVAEKRIGNKLEEIFEMGIRLLDWIIYLHSEGSFRAGRRCRNLSSLAGG